MYKIEINLLIKYKNIKIIYPTYKQFWGITFSGIKIRLGKNDFNALLGYKTLISYKSSKLKNIFLNKQKVLLK